MLTYRQRQLFDYLKAEISWSGITPTFQQMSDHLGSGSKSRVSALLDGIEKRGLIRRMKGRQQAIEIVSNVRPFPRTQVFKFNDITKELEPFA